jgi:ribonuclease-3
MDTFKAKFLSFSSITLVIALLATPLHAGKNKESFTPHPDVFSQSDDIDYPRLHTHLHYSFKDTNLLRDALHPMLPKKLNSSKQQFDQLEFLGDSVLSLIIRKRLIDLFPNGDRGHLAQMYDLLTQNKTLTETFLWNLDIEKYLPFPEQPYEICNVAEALIGAIHKDDAQNGMNNATTFVMRLLDGDVINQKISEFSGKKGITFTPKILPEQEKAIREVCTPKNVGSLSPKSLLNEVLLKIFNDRPEYITSLKKTDDGRVLFSCTVIGAQIGKKITGLGNKVQEAEENAARNALNALAQDLLYDIKEPQNSGNNFRYQLSEIVKFLVITPTTSCDDAVAPFNYEIKLESDIIGKGVGKRKSEAEENAAQEACHFLAQREEEKQQIYQDIRLSELKQKRAAPVMANQPLPPAALPEAALDEPTSLRKPVALAPVDPTSESSEVKSPVPPQAKENVDKKDSPKKRKPRKRNKNKKPSSDIN